MLNWFKRKGAAAPKYQRTVTDMDRRFYTADAEFYDQTPKSIAEAIDNLSNRLALPAKSETYPLSPETIAQASAAFAPLVRLDRAGSAVVPSQVSTNSTAAPCG